jgi:hypothetical protein
MSTLMQEIFYEFESGVGVVKPVTAKPKVRYFSCNSTDHKKIETLLSMSVTSASLREAVETAAATAVSWAYKAIASLRVSPRNASTISIFKKAFAQQPDWNPSWKTSQMKWFDWGDLIATRLEKAALILNGGHIKYFCYGSKSYCSECTNPASSYISCSSFKGRYTICLGDHFWLDWKNRKFDSLASNLLHEALHIYFGTTVAHSGRSGNASCYQRFVSAINGKPLLARLATRCPASP